MEIEPSHSNFPYHEKIGKILQKFLLPNFEVKNDVHLNLFLTRLIGKTEGGKSPRLQGNEQLNAQFCQWLIEASDIWEKGNVSPPMTILSFALNLTSHLSHDEQAFFKLNSQNVFESLIKVAQATLNECPGVTVEILTLLCSFLEHKHGVQWVMATPYWNHLLNLGLSAGATMYIKQKVYQFIAKLLEKTITLNRNFTVNLVKLLTMPIQEVLSSLLSENGPPLTENEDADLFEFLKPTLSLVSEVLTTLLKKFNANVLELFLEQEVPDTTEQLYLFSQNQDFTFELLKIQFAFLFYNMRLKLDKENTETHNSASRHDIKTMFDLISKEMCKNNVRCVVKISAYAHMLYDILAHNIPLCIRKGDLIEFQTQMALFRLTPILIISLQLWGGKKPDGEQRRQFLRSSLKLAAIKSVEMCFKWRNKLANKSDLMEDVTFCLQFFTRTKKHFTKKMAATTFTTLVYIVYDIVNALTRVDFIPRRFLAQYAAKEGYIEFIKTILDTVVDIVETFDLSWNDTVEILLVMDLAHDFLRYSDWSDERVIIKGLKLLKTAVSKYMSPNMVLLVYTNEDSTVCKTGSLLYTKCHSSSWEIRNGALEVVHALSVNASTNFPALTHVLLKVKLPQLVVKLALNDDQPRVRATAFKCLQEMIQIEELWDVVINTDSFLIRILNVFENETEGKVRQEATTLVFLIYKFQNFSDDMLLRLYDVMTHAAIEDLYWEVKCSALEFWFQTWKVFLTNQGMIDRSFPSHTFSKELKKIIALTDAEVNKRIIKVLNQLSQIGCLYVMKCAVQDNCNSEVSKKAVSFTMDLLKMFRKYKISENCENMDISDPPFVQANNRQDELMFCNPARSVSPSTLTAFGSDYCGDYLESPCPTSYFDMPSPPPVSSSLDVGLLSSVSAKLQKQEVPTWALPCSTELSQVQPGTDKQNSPIHSPISDQNSTSNINSSNQSDDMNVCEPLVDICEYSEDRWKTTQFGNINSNVNSGSVQGEKVFEELINLIGIASFEQFHSSSNQVMNSNKLKIRTYLAPSQYVKFVYDEVETLSSEKEESNLHEFDSLLNEILKVYNVIDNNNN